MLFDGALLCLVVGRLAGGRFSRLGDLRIRWAWAIFLGFALQAALMLLTRRYGLAPAMRWSGAAAIVSYLFIFIGLAANIRSRYFQVIAVGVVMNFLAVAANGGHMPVDRQALIRSGETQLVTMLDQGRSGKHALLTPTTRLAFLGDRLLLPPPYPRPCVFSLGDIPITLGICALLLAGMGAFGLRTPSPPGGEEVGGGVRSLP